MADAIEQQGCDVVIRLKVVPGASRTALAGMLGDRIKLRVAAPPEGGKANAAVMQFLATALGVKQSQVTIERGHTSAEKTVRVNAFDARTVRRAFGTG